jgi:hypothetical protein
VIGYCVFSPGAIFFARISLAGTSFTCPSIHTTTVWSFAACYLYSLSMANWTPAVIFDTSSKCSEGSIIAKPVVCSTHEFPFFIVILKFFLRVLPGGLAKGIEEMAIALQGLMYLIIFELHEAHRQ